MARMTETEAPSWLPFVFFAIPAAIFAVVMVWAVRSRRARSRSRRGEASRPGPDSVAQGSGSAIRDPAAINAEGIEQALAIGDAPSGRPGEPLAATAARLGLRSRISTATHLLEAHFAYGERHGRQVFARIGPDEKIAGGSVMTSNKHVRVLCVVRVAAPELLLAERDGRLQGDPSTPPEVAAVLDGLSASELWRHVHVRGGPDGIVFSRPALDDATGRAWLDGLWLLERIADKLRLPPLEPDRLGPSWTVPYGLGREVP